MKKKLNVIDLFCGAGGFSEGFKQAGFDVLVGVDHILRFTQSFKENNEGAEAIYKDIRELGLEEIKEKIGNKKVHVVVGGPPCQGFSLAGLRDAKDPRNSLFMEYVRILKGLNSPWFVMENVPGMLSMKNAEGERVVDIIESEFKKIGYEIKYKILLAADYGVPQKRRRLIFIGTNTGQNINFPEPTHAEKSYMTIDGRKIEKWVPVKSVLQGENDVPANCFHSSRMIEGFRKRREKHAKKGNGFGWQILDPESPSYTISARYWKDGSDALVKYSEDRIRMLTPEECAAIQSFPRGYKFVGSKKERYTQIGNAVPPMLTKVIAEELKKLI